MPSIDIRSRVRQRMLKFDTEFKEALKEELDPIAKKMVTKFRRAVSNWTAKPIFSYRITIKKKSIRLTVFPKGTARQQFLWVDRGTKPYTIYPKNGGFLRFQPGYNAKTQPIARYGVGDGSRFGGWVAAKQVNHPGIRARKFGEKFSQDILPDLREAKENAFRRATRRS